MIPVYMEQPGTRWTPDRQRRYWRQSSEAAAAGHPYLVIRPRGRHARICCDWITSRPVTRDGPRPADLFSRMTADHLAACWPETKVKCLGVYTSLRVPLAQAAPIAEDIAALARLAMRLLPSTAGHC